MMTNQSETFASKLSDSEVVTLLAKHLNGDNTNHDHDIEGVDLSPNDMIEIIDGSEFEKEFADQLDDDTRKAVALALAMGLDITDIVLECDDRFTVSSNEEYMVLLDDEAETMWDEQLENILDELALAEVPESLRTYFDREKWIQDAKIDGRGHTLSSYDGNENDYHFGGVDFYIYRM